MSCVQWNVHINGWPHKIHTKYGKYSSHNTFHSSPKHTSDWTSHSCAPPPHFCYWISSALHTFCGCTDRTGKILSNLMDRNPWHTAVSGSLSVQQWEAVRRARPRQLRVDGCKVSSRKALYPECTLGLPLTIIFIIRSFYRLCSQFID